MWWNMVLLKVNNLNYNDFHDINLSFNSGNFYTFIGGNNSGKTTLFRILSSLIMTNNTINCNNILLNSKNRYLYLKNIGIVERINKYSFNFKTVKDELMYPLINLGLFKLDILKRIRVLLDFFVVSYLLNKKVNDLNIYEKQELLIIISLLHFPKVLIMDDVLSIFNSSLRKKIIEKLNILKKNNMVIINFSSNLDDLENTDKIILLNNFKVIKEIDYMDIYDNDKLLYDNNIEIPFIVDLSIKLKMYNVINKNYINLKKMVDDIWE